MPKVEQEYATPGEAYLAHFGKKGMRWGVRSPVDQTTGLINRKTQAAKQSVKGAATKTSDGAHRTVSGAKKSVTGTVNNKVDGVKAGAQARADAKKAKVAAKKDAVANNVAVKQVGHEFKGAAWGTRQAYIEKTLKDAERTASIAKGTAGIDSKVIAVKDGVVGKRSAKYANKVFERHAKRMQSGELLTRDTLLMGARLRRRDLTIGMDIAGKANDASKKRGRADGAQFKIKAKLVKKEN